MDIETFEMFMELADVRSYSLAAANKNISQSSLSKAILKLEGELRVRLINRDCRPIELTPAGERLYQDLLDLQPQYVLMLQHMKSFSQKRMISCGGVPALKFFSLMNILKDFQHRHADIDITSSQIHLITEGLVRLQQGKIDYLFAHRPLRLRQEFQMTILTADPLCIVVPKKHPFAERKSVQLSELDGCRFMESVFMNSIVQDLVANRGLLANDVMVCTGIRRDELLMSLAYERRIMLCFWSDISVYKMDEYRAIPVRGCPQMPVALFEIPDANKPAYLQTFKDFVLDAFKKNEKGTA